MKKINLEDYSYTLHESKIAKYPLKERDQSSLLLSLSGKISHDKFRNIGNYLTNEDILVFNDSRVVRARIHMRKETGAMIEVFCLEPHLPIDFERNFSSFGPVKWKCLIGNLKKWKSGMISTRFTYKGVERYFWARRLEQTGDSWIVEFDWNDKSLSFSEILTLTGKVPIPPYLNRPDEEIDIDRYQTIYCKTDGSVAAPTAGLHFTDRVIKDLENRGIRKTSITLHVSAGTFKPVKGISITDHEMHTEHFYATPGSIEAIKNGRVISVGTTSLRTLESIYWIGVSLVCGKFNPAIGPYVGQWDPYGPHREISPADALDAVYSYIESLSSRVLEARTSLLIVPGYRFRIVKGLITNFHQPRSTLLLLVAAFAGEKWKEMYYYALDNDFRLLSYGDSSLIIP
ncbi:MAG: S-adenosylmethionine:tRNA ribosyltransferase-isomerase [Bacteroidales bacterium]